MGNLYRCNDHNIYGKLPVNETVETRVTSTCLSADCLELNTDCILNKLLYTESIKIGLKHNFCLPGKMSTE
jgi:hypothetical protein